jgi:hypothetical protein
MKNKLKFNLLFILLILMIPTVVNAASIKLGSATSEEGKTTFPIVLLGNEIKSGDVIDLKGSVSDNAMLNVGTIDFKNGVGKNGAVAADKTIPTDGMEIGTITITNSTDSNQTGKLSIRGTYKPLDGSSSDLIISETSITVKGARKKSASSKFTSIKPSQGTITPEFKSDVYEYTVYNIKDTINSVTINYTCDNCTVSSTHANASKGSSSVKIGDLNKGENKVELKVTSENGENSDTYTINIIRGETEFNSARIRTIQFGDSKTTPDYKSDVYEYTVQVPNSVKDVNKILSIELEDPTATYEVKGGDELNVGENTVEITVTSALKDNTQIYIFKVTRLNSDECILVSYSEKDDKVVFIDADQKRQEMTIDEFKTAYPKVYEDIKNKKYKFDENGNVINDDKKDKKSNTKTIITIIIIIVGVIVIGLSGYFIFRKKDPEKEKEKIKKKAMKKARKDELKKLEEEYYKEYYEDEYEGEEATEDTEESAETDETDEEVPEKDKLDESEKESLLEDDYIFESSLIEDEQEEEEEKPKKKKDEVVDIDTALEDLMNTKTYDFSDELKDVDDEE